jgi:hypothetical protein
LDTKTVIGIALRGVIVPALAAAGLFVLISGLWPSDVARRYRCGVSFAVGAFVGFVLLPSTSTLAPGQFYEWVLYIAILGAFVAGLTRADGVTRGERWTAIYVFAPIAAWLIVPQWPSAVPAWQIQWAGVSLAIMLLTALLYPLPQMLSGRSLPWWLMLVLAATSVILFDQSETFGMLAALATGALAGCAVAALFARELPDWRSLVLPYVIVLVGYAYTGAVYPTEPKWLMLLLPLVPLALWICSVGPFARLTGFRAIAVQAASVVVPLVIIAALLLANTNGGADDW